MSILSDRLEFAGGLGASLAGRLDRPVGTPKAYALFAHCFTCTKDIFAARNLAAELAGHGIAVLRFDFTGLGSSEGEFASTNFSSNVDDLVRAADVLRERYAAPTILIGHSLGGAAVLAAAGRIPEVKAVATIGAPADADHVIHNFHADVERIEADGEARVSLAGRQFTIRKQFLDDLRGHTLTDRIAELKAAVLVMHSPIDNVVGVDNAGRIFAAARHPKSFVSLDRADHLLSDHEDARYAAHVIAAWASRFLPEASVHETASGEDTIRVAMTGNGKFETAVRVGPHTLVADEPKSYGGDARGPTPYDYVAAGLGACTVMTMRMYADRKGWTDVDFSAEVDHDKVHAKDCADCAGEVADRSGKLDRFERRITISANASAEQRAKLLEIADKCPVHRTLSEGAAIVSYDVSEN